MNFFAHLARRARSCTQFRLALGEMMALGVPVPIPEVIAKYEDFLLTKYACEFANFMWKRCGVNLTEFGFKC